ncbi:MAG: ATP-binding protein [Bacteroidia bacterium]|nr:ATP-binding protein [Bacteroidia bacterium]
MILRSLIAEAEQTAKEFKIVCVTGPRQSGKTTLCRQVFKSKPYVSLEDPDIAAQAIKDTHGFLNQYKNGAVLDEAQRVPQLFNYLQTIVDSKRGNGQFVLSGSNNFLMQDNISQTLAGRVGYIELLPLSLNELNPGKTAITMEERILQGFYPAVVTRQSTYKRWFPNYIKTYVERDVRMIRNIGNIILFNKFLKLCAGRAAQLLNINNLANEVGVDNKTIQAWLAVLESSYIAYLLPPYHQNFSKRVIKSPKLYFYDTGLLCSLLNITSVEGLKKSPQYGALFENFIVSELKKNRSNKEQFGSLFFFRDSSGNEVDVIIENEDGLKPIEIKSSKKTDLSQFKNLKWFQKVFRQEGGILIYAGEKENQFQNGIGVLGWKEIAGL